MSKSLPSVVVIGGGTGTFVVLKGLKDQPLRLTALMTMVDDGGSNKVLRDEFGLLPTSGIRQAMVALSAKNGLLRDLFNYRYHQGTGISGMTFGNLFMAAMADILGSQEKAIQETAKFLSVKGRILPISYDDVRLVATYEDGSEVLGEHRIDEVKHNGRLKVKRLRTIPKAKINSEAIAAIKSADLIILGPGDFYTNTIADLVVDGVVGAIKASPAKVLFIVNLMTKFGETFNYRAGDFLADLDTYLPLSRISYVLINSHANYPPWVLEKYQAEQSNPVADNLETVNLPSTLKIFRRQMLSDHIPEPQPGDKLNRSLLRHDPNKLAEAVMAILQT